MKKIGIIGMGVSGLGILLALSKCDPKQLTNLDITCFDDTEHFGRGIPFQDDDASALINSPIDDVSFDYQHMGDFKEWLEENGYETDSAYVSRALYGQYMIERMDDLLKQLAVTVVKHHVEDLHYLANTSQWQVKVNGDPYEVQFD
ncbi:FAD/NAD(P)-binding protein, partial [Streptococcus pluranimalium]